MKKNIFIATILLLSVPFSTNAFAHISVKNKISENVNLPIDSSLIKVKKDTVVYYARPERGAVYKEHEVYYEDGKEIGARSWNEDGNMIQDAYSSSFESGNTINILFYDSKIRRIKQINFGKNDTLKKIITFYFNQQIHVENNYLNQKTPIGEGKEYAENGKLLSIVYRDDNGNYIKTVNFIKKDSSILKNDTIQKEYKQSYSNGNKKVQGQLKNGKYDGTFSYWDEKGELLYTEEYKHGVLKKINFGNDKTEQEEHKKNIQKIINFVAYLHKLNTAVFDTLGLLTYPNIDTTKNSLDTIVTDFFSPEAINAYFQEKKGLLISVNLNFLGRMTDSINISTLNNSFKVFNYMDAQKMNMKGLEILDNSQGFYGNLPFFLIENVYFISVSENGKKTYIYILMENNKIKSITPERADTNPDYHKFGIVKWNL